MCYKAPGPRCSSHTWNERVSKGQARSLAFQHRQAIETEVAAHSARHPNAELPLELTRAHDSANDEFSYANSAFLRANKDWHQSPHGLNTLGFQLAEMAGQVNEENRARFIQAKTQVEDILTRIGKAESSGEKVSPEFKTERKAALENYYDTVRTSSMRFNGLVAQHMNRHKDKFSVPSNKPQMADKVDMSNINHIKAILDYGTTARNDGSVKNPEGFTRFAHTLSAASAERGYMLSLYRDENKKMSDEPMDDHRPRTAENEATRRRQTNPDTSKVYNEGEKYGDITPAKIMKAKKDQEADSQESYRDFSTAIEYISTQNGIMSGRKV